MIKSSRPFEHNERLLTTLVEIVGRALQVFNLRMREQREEKQTSSLTSGTSKSLEALNLIGSYVSAHLVEEQTYEIRTDRIEIYLEKRQSSKLRRDIRALSGRFLLNYQLCQLVKVGYYSGDECATQIVTQQVLF
jgi:hypothetical protein